MIRRDRRSRAQRLLSIPVVSCPVQRQRDVDDHLASGASLLENGDEQTPTDIFTGGQDLRRRSEAYGCYRAAPAGPHVHANVDARPQRQLGVPLPCVAAHLSGAHESHGPGKEW